MTGGSTTTPGTTTGGATTGVLAVVGWLVGGGSNTVQNVTQQSVMSRQVLDTIPTGIMASDNIQYAPVGTAPTAPFFLN